VASFSTVDLKSSASSTRRSRPDRRHRPAVQLFGLPGATFSPADVMKVNFSGMRHWTEQWLPRVRKGGAIASISSTAGFGYLQRMPTVLEFLATPDFDAASTWVETHADVVTEGYTSRRRRSASGPC